MKSYVCTFLKKSGESRKMHFVELKSVPENYLVWSRQKNNNNTEGEQTSGARVLSEGMKRVFDLEKRDIRIINLNTIIGKIEEVEINEKEYFINN